MVFMVSLWLLLPSLVTALMSGIGFLRVMYAVFLYIGAISIILVPRYLGVSNVKRLIFRLSHYLGILLVISFHRLNQKSHVSNIYFENIKADAFDLDFGELSFNNIVCNNINNDCLDVSGARVFGENLLSKNTFDKGVSVGENSNIKITNIKTLNNNVGLAVKDGSKAIFKNVEFDKNNFDILVFNKKQEFSKPSLIVDSLKKINKKKILQSQGTKLVINNKNFVGNLKDDFINSIIY